MAIPQHQYVKLLDLDIKLSHEMNTPIVSKWNLSESPISESGGCCPPREGNILTLLPVAMDIGRG